MNIVFIKRAAIVLLSTSGCYQTSTVRATPYWLVCSSSSSSSSSSSDFMGWVSSQLLLPNSLLSVNLYSLLLKTSSDGASTTYCGNRFQQFTTFWLKKHILHCFSVLFCTVCSYILKALQYLYQLWWRINNLRQLVTNICYSHWQLVPVSM